MYNTFSRSENHLFKDMLTVTSKHSFLFIMAILWVEIIQYSWCMSQVDQRFLFSLIRILNLYL